MSRSQRSAPSVPNLVDLLYAVPAFAGSLALGSTTSALGIGLLGTATLSWFQDWLSAKAAASYFQGRLTLLDAITAANYFGLFLALERAGDASPVASHAVLVHYTAIFVIYALWNICLYRDSDPPTRRFLAGFGIVSAAEAVLAGSVIYTRARLPLAIALAAHVLVLFAWRRIQPSEDTGDR